MKSNNLGRRLGRAFLLHAVLISVVAVLGVFAAGFILKGIMIKQALRDEAQFFWQRYAQDTQTPPPVTRNLTGYLATADTTAGLPEHLRGLSLGFHNLVPASNVLIYVTEQYGTRLYLIFDGERVSELATYFGLVPLAGILIVLYLAAWWTYRLSRRVVSPIIWLAQEVNRLDPQTPDSQTFAPERLPGDGNEELWVLAAALKDLAERLNAFVERERNFTRDASHELRSPLTVIKMATELLLNDAELSEQTQRSVLRIRQQADEMEELVKMFLLLARESDDNLSLEPVDINAVVETELQRASLLAGDKPITVEHSADCRLIVPGSKKVLSVLIGNLLRNAFSYTDAGRVRVHVSAGELLIEDSGVGIPEQQVKDVFRPYFRANTRQRGGYGVGLTIVKRLSERFRWPVRIDSQVGSGTRVIVEFPEARQEPLNC
ncbi:MAG: HAMP domain-containing sensor histidine kinase [Candidatus Competibacteraceae bacterium]